MRIRRKKRMKPLKIMSKITPLVSKAGVFVNDKAPEILVIGGIFVVVGAGILAVKQTLDKVPEIVDEHDELAEMINSTSCEEMTEEENEKDRAKSLKKNDRHMALQLVKTYALPVGMAAVGVTAILAGNHLLRSRYVAVVAGMSALQQSYDKYRERIVDKFGEAADHYAAYGFEEEIYEETEVDEKGKEKKVSAKREVMTDASAHSPYFRWIGPDSSLYRECHGDPIYIRNQLEIYENVCNQMYDEGRALYFNNILTYIFGNDPDVMSDDGQIVGWYKYDKKNKVMTDDGRPINFRIGSVHNVTDDGQSQIWFYIDPNVAGPVRLGH
jgi:hypothetical protein